MTARDRHLPTFKGALKRRILTYGQKTSQDVSYMTFWDETVLGFLRRFPIQVLTKLSPAKLQWATSLGLQADMAAVILIL